MSYASRANNYNSRRDDYGYSASTYRPAEQREREREREREWRFSPKDPQLDRYRSGPDYPERAHVRVASQDNERDHSRRPAPREPNRDRAVSLSSQPSKMDSEQHTSVQDMSKVLMQWGRIMIDKTRLVIKKDAEEKVMHQKKQDYDKNKAKSELFPSVVETYRKHQASHKQKCDKLDESLAKVDAEYKNIADSFAVSLAKSFFGKGLQVHLLEAVKSEQDPELPKKLASLETKMATVAAEEARAKTFRASQVAKQIAQDEQLRKLEEQISALQNHQVKDQSNEVAALKKETESLQAERSLQDLEIASLKDKVKVLETTLVKASEEIKAIQTGLQTSIQAASTPPNEVYEEMKTLRESVEMLRGSVEATDMKFADVDIDNFDVAIELATLGFPEFVRRFEEHKEDLRRLKDETVPDVTKHVTGIRIAQDKMIEAVGQMIESERSKHERHEARIQNLEAKPVYSSQPLAARQVQSSIPAPAPATAPATGPGTGPTALSIDTSSRLQSAEAQIEQLRNDYLLKYNALELMCTTLNSQFSNLTTASLAELMIGQMEKVYPNPGKIVADLQILQEKMVSIEQFKKEVEDREYRREKMVKHKHDDFLASIANIPKKRKTESSPNGSGQEVLNGGDSIVT